MDRGLLNRATSDDADPTPGYMFNDIAKMTFVSFQACQQIEEYLFKKLAKDSPNVKAKVLRILKHVCEKGRPDFKRNLQRRVDAIKQCLHYRGPPDPLKGDEPSRRVQAAAQEVMAAVWDTTDAPSEAQAPSSRIQGFGSDGSSFDNRPPASSVSSSHSHAPSSGGYQGGSSGGYHGGSSGGYGGGMVSNGKMTGFGNPSFNNVPKSASMLQRVKDSVQQKFAKKEDKPTFNTQFSSFNQTHATYQSPATSAGGFKAPSSVNSFSNTPAPSTASSHSMGVPGGGWASAPSSNSSGAFKSGAGSFSTASSRPSGSAPQQSAEPGEYEARLVDDITQPGGARVQPPKEVLVAFCGRCASLEPEVVCPLLENKLDDDAWQVRLKTLYVVEGLIEAGLDGYISYFLDHPEFIQAQIQSPQLQLRHKAAKLLKLLGDDSVQIEEAPKKQPTQHQPAVRHAPVSPASSAGDLLDMGGDMRSSPTSSPPNMSAQNDLLSFGEPEKSSPNGSLMSFLEASAVHSQAQHGHSNSHNTSNVAGATTLFQSLSIKQQSQPQTAQTQSGDRGASPLEFSDVALPAPLQPHTNASSASHTQQNDPLSLLSFAPSSASSAPPSKAPHSTNMSAFAALGTPQAPPSSTPQMPNIAALYNQPPSIPGVPGPTPYPMYAYPAGTAGVRPAAAGVGGPVAYYPYIMAYPGNLPPGTIPATAMQVGPMGQPIGQNMPPQFPQQFVPTTGVPSGPPPMAVFAAADRARSNSGSKEGSGFNFLNGGSPAKAPDQFDFVKDQLKPSKV